jgi:hypothetical protein
MSIFGLTDNYGFNLIDFASQTWHTDEYDNWRKLDVLLTGIASNVPFAVDTGIADAYLVSYTPAISAYTSGLVIAFKPIHDNTGACTINVNGLGVKNIQFQGAALAAGRIKNNGYVKLTYNGNHFEVIDPKIVDITPPDGSITPAKLTTGAMTWDGSGNLSVGGTLTAVGAAKASDFKSTTNQIFFRQASNAFLSASITYSTSAPSGGNDGDLWFQYT